MDHTVGTCLLSRLRGRARAHASSDNGNTGQTLDSEGHQAPSGDEQRTTYPWCTCSARTMPAPSDVRVIHGAESTVGAGRWLSLAGDAAAA